MVAWMRYQGGGDYQWIPAKKDCNYVGGVVSYSWRLMIKFYGWGFVEY